eukprot:scaffold10.g2259.t1
MLPPVYIGNYEYDADERELERLFEKYGKVDRVEFKSGFCFVHYYDKRDAEDAIHDLDKRVGAAPFVGGARAAAGGREWGRQRRRLRVEFAKNDANVREREKARRESAQPNKTLFVAGFDPRSIRTRDMEEAFERFGKLRVSAGSGGLAVRLARCAEPRAWLSTCPPRPDSSPAPPTAPWHPPQRCEIKKTFAFVEFYDVADAKEACEKMHGERVMDREITVEYVVNKDRAAGDWGSAGGYGGGGGGYGGPPPRRYDDRRGGYDDRGGYGRARSRSRSPVERRRRRSPSYDRDRRRSPSYDRRRSPSRSPPRRGRSPSPRRRDPSPRRGRSPSRSPRRAPPRGRSDSRSPMRSRSPVGRPDSRDASPRRD